MACGENDPEPRKKEEHMCDHKKSSISCYGEYGLGTCIGERCFFADGCKKWEKSCTIPAPGQS